MRCAQLEVVSMPAILRNSVSIRQRHSVTAFRSNRWVETIGDRVRAEREAQKLSRPVLARAVGIAPTTLSDLELGLSKSTTALHKIAARLGVRVEWLETGKSPKVDPETGSQSAGLDVGKLADLLGTVEAAVEKARIKLPPMVKARLVATLYADKEASAAASAQAVQAALVGILATMETNDEPTAAR